MEDKPGTQPVSEGNSSPSPPVKRMKKASRAVLFSDAVADRTIRIGGMALILAVLGILVFLIHQTPPLFRGGKIIAEKEYRLELPACPVLLKSMDEYLTLGFLLFEDGSVRLFHLKTGTLLDSPNTGLGSSAVTAFSHTPDKEDLIFGFADGTVQFGKAVFKTDILTPEGVPSGLKKLDDRDGTDGSSVYSRISGNRIRRTYLSFEMEDSTQVSESSRPILALDYRVSGQAERRTRVFATVDDEGTAILNLAESHINLPSGANRTTVTRTELPLIPNPGFLARIILTENADAVFAADVRGRVYRYNTGDVDHPFLAETLQVLPDGVELSAFGLLLGGQSIVVGGSDGSVNLFLLLDGQKARTLDGMTFVKAREFPSMQGAVRWFDPGLRGKSFAVADTTGAIRVLHGAGRRNLVSFTGNRDGTPLKGPALAPRVDALLALDSDGTTRFREFSVPPPEPTFESLLGRVRYEGHS